MSTDSPGETPLKGRYFDIFSSRSIITPSRKAVIDYSKGGRDFYTYNDIHETGGKLARGLVRLGIKEGDRIAVLAPNIIEYIYLFVASTRLKTPLVPLNYRLSVRELDHMVRLVRPKILIVDEDFYEKASELVKTVDEIKILYTGKEPPPFKAYSSLRTIMGESVVERPLKPIKDEDIAFILFTGGSTGVPKGALISYRQVLWNAINTVLSWGLVPDDVAPLLFPFFHTGGWNVITIPMFYIGGSIILMRYFDPRLTLRVIEKERATVVIGVPTMFYEMTRMPEFFSTDFSSVRFFKSGGGMTPSTLLEKYLNLGKPFYQGYGLTEAGPNLLYTPPEIVKEAPMSVGKQSIFVELKVVNEKGEEVGPNKVGELIVRGPITFSGYLGMEKETEETILPGGWVRTGDLFTYDEKGYFYFVERKKFMIKSGGENVYPTEVEEAIRKHPLVEDAAVFGVPDPKWGEAVAALIVPKGSIDPKELKSYLKKHIAGYKIPKYVWFVNEIPKTPVGKIDYTGIRKEYSKRLREAVKL